MDQKEMWKVRIAEQEASGKTIKEWCGEMGIPVSTFQGWKRRLRKAADEPPKEPQFVEVPKHLTRATENKIVALIRAKDVEIELYTAADSEVIRLIIEAVRAC